MIDWPASLTARNLLLLLVVLVQPALWLSGDSVSVVTAGVDACITAIAIQGIHWVRPADPNARARRPKGLELTMSGFVGTLEAKRSHHSRTGRFPAVLLSTLVAGLTLVFVRSPPDLSNWFFSLQAIVQVTGIPVNPNTVAFCLVHVWVALGVAGVLGAVGGRWSRRAPIPVALDGKMLTHDGTKVALPGTTVSIDRLRQRMTVGPLSIEADLDHLLWLKDRMEDATVDVGAIDQVPDALVQVVRGKRESS